MLKIKIKLHSKQFTAVLLSMVISLSPSSTGDYFFIVMIHSEIISGERTLYKTDKFVQSGVTQK